MKIADKRKAGKSLGRAGIAEMIIAFVDEFNKDDTYKAAVRLSGQLHAMADSCGWDEYWSEKAADGKQNAEFKLSQAIKKQDES